MHSVVRRACTKCTHTDAHTVKQSKIKFHHFLFHQHFRPVLFTLHRLNFPPPTSQAIISHVQLPVGRKETNSYALFLFRVRFVRASFIRFFFSFSRERKKKKQNLLLSSPCPSGFISIPSFSEQSV